MGEKSQHYNNVTGRFHIAKQNIKERWGSLKEKCKNINQKDVKGSNSPGVKQKANEFKEDMITKINHGDKEYNHIYRRKNRWELTKISAAVMGIEFSYAAETAFVSPTLLKIGVLHEHMTLIWCLSPLIGFFLTPIMGSLSDRCKSNLGRRRPFIILLSIGVIFGLILVPNGKLLGKQFGDKYPYEEALAKAKLEKQNQEQLETSEEPDGPGGRLYGSDYEYHKELISNITIKDGDPKPQFVHEEHPWGIFFTVLGTVLLDFDADACQSPSRAYLLDVTTAEDHAIGLSTFTIMAGLGGSLGYAMGGLDWGVLGALFGGHVRLVFTLVLFIYIACVFVTLTSFPEMPLSTLENETSGTQCGEGTNRYTEFVPDDGDAHEMEKLNCTQSSNNDLNINVKLIENSAEFSAGNPFANPKESNGNYFSTDTKSNERNKHLEVKKASETSISQASPMPNEDGELSAKASMATLTQYLWSIIFMPNSMKVLCVTNLFCWMSLVCYSLYFTDFVGEAVFKGNPVADPGSKERKLYDEGVRFGCWGMAMYSLSCSCYSFVIEKLVKTFRAKPVYIGGQLVYCIGMIFMAWFRTKWGVLLFSWSAGVMYSTLFTMPYLIVAHYHETNTYSEGEPSEESQVRGIGTDVGIVSCMVFLAQFILSLTMGSIIAAFHSTTVVVIAASVLSFCGAISACFVTYLDL